MLLYSVISRKTYSMHFTTTILLVALCGLALASSPTKNQAIESTDNEGPSTITTVVHRSRRAAGNVVVVFRTKEPYEDGKNGENLKIVKQKLAAFARANKVDSSQLKPTLRNVEGNFAARIEIVGAVGVCGDVKKFVRRALNELPQVTDAKVKCGDALGTTVTRN